MRIDRHRWSFLGGKRAWHFVVFAACLASATEGRAGALDDLLAAALQHNPEIQRARAETQAALARIPQSASLPDPALAAETMGTDVVGSAQSIRLSQAFPWPGTLGRRDAVATWQARAFAFEVRAIELRVAAAIRAQAAEIAYLQHEATLIGRNLRLYRKQEDFLEQAVRAGSEVADLLRVEMESELLRDERAQIDETRTRAAAELAAVVGAEIEPASLASLTLALPEIDVPRAPDLEDSLRHRSPTLLAQTARIEAAQAGVVLARLETYPEWMVSAGYRRDSEPRPGGGRESMHEAIAMLSVTLPLWTPKNRGRRDEAAAMAEAAQQEHAAALRMLHAELTAALSRERDAARRVRLYRDRLTPKAQQTHDAVETAYRAGNASLLDLFTERRRLLDSERGYWRAVADLHVARAQRDALVDAGGAEEGLQP